MRLVFRLLTLGAHTAVEKDMGHLAVPDVVCEVPTRLKLQTINDPKAAKLTTRTRKVKASAISLGITYCSFFCSGHKIATNHGPARVNTSD